MSLLRDPPTVLGNPLLIWSPGSPPFTLSNDSSVWFGGSDLWVFLECHWCSVHSLITLLFRVSAMVFRECHWCSVHYLMMLLFCASAIVRYCCLRIDCIWCYHKKFLRGFLKSSYFFTKNFVVSQIFWDVPPLPGEFAFHFRNFDICAFPPVSLGYSPT